MPATNPPGAGLRVMYDAVTPRNIPASAEMVAGYVDGRYAWSAADWARFPGAVKVKIAVFASTNDGHVLDVERGNATPVEAPGWVLKRRAAGVDPTVYCSAAAWPAVREAFAAAHVPEPHWWIAAYPGIGATLYPGTVAHQYADPGPYDVSVVADYWPGVDRAPAHQTTPAGDWFSMATQADLEAAIAAQIPAIAQAVWHYAMVDWNDHKTYPAQSMLVGSRASVARIEGAVNAIAAKTATAADIKAAIQAAIIAEEASDNQGGSAPTGV